MWGNGPTKEEMEKLTQDRDALLNSINQEKTNLQDVQKEAEEAEQQKRKTEQEVLGVQSSLEKLQEAETNIRENVDKLEQELKRAKAEREKEEKMLAGIKKEIQEAEKTRDQSIQTLNDEVEKARIHSGERVQYFDEQVVDAQSNLETVESELEESREELKKTEDSLTVAKQEVKEAQEEMTEIDERKLVVEKEIDGERNKAELYLDQTDKAIANKKQELGLITANLDDVNVALAETKAKKKELETELESMQKEVDEHRKAFVNLSQREERLREFCDEKGIDYSNF